jgi:HAD superfamily hydrolase (TIGR01509 family)
MSHPALAAVFFDMDGVVIDTHTAVTRFWQDLARAHGRELTPEDFAEHVYGCTAAHTLERLFPYFDPRRCAEVIAGLRADEAEQIYRPIAGVLALLDSLHSHDVPTALVTSGETHKVREVSRQLGLDGAFSACVTADDIRIGKPDPECYLRAASRVSQEPAVCLVFEDAVSGVEAARRAGMRCVGVQTSALLSARLRSAGAWTVIPDFSTVSLSSGDTPESLVLSLGPNHRVSIHR